MTVRKPDFYVMKREGLDGVPEWFTFDADGHVWDYQLTLRHRFVTEADAAKIAKKYGGRVVPVFCTSKRAEPKMRGHSFSWALARMKEGKRVRRASWENPRDSFEIASGEIVGRARSKRSGIVMGEWQSLSVARWGNWSSSILYRVTVWRKKR
jgi:hypothetical protein